MIGIVLLIIFIICGNLIARQIFVDRPFLVQICASLLFGVLGLMWLVIPFAFFYGFSAVSHLCGLLVMIIITVLVLRFIPRRENLQQREVVPVSLGVTIAMISLIIISLMYLHILFPKDGAWYAGQSVYGDHPLHYGIITSLVEQDVFPPIYTIYPDMPLGYPFLSDSLSATFYLFGLSLRWSVLIPSFLMVLIVVMGFIILTKEVLKDKWSTILAAGLFFFNGGLGFMYFLDGFKKNPDHFTRLFNGFYFTPTNWYDHNFSLFNVICHVLIPQRTTLAGWTVLFFVLWLLHASLTKKENNYFVLAGILAGLMPMLHTHVFLGLCIICATWAIVYFFPAEDKIQYIKNWFKFGIPVLVLALPQILIWTLPQVSEKQFIYFHYNWDNDQDIWIWFWVKYVGVVFLALISALFSASKKQWRFYSGALVIFCLAEIIAFSPDPINNYKLFFVWLAFSIILVAGHVMDVFRKLKGIRGRTLLLGMFIFFATFSAGLTVAHDYVTSYMLYSPEEIAAAEFIKKFTLQDGLFLVAAPYHNNPVSSLAGRNIVCGEASYLYSHGMDYDSRAEDVAFMYSLPEHFERLRKKYGVDYVYISDYEKNNYNITSEYFDQSYPIVYKTPGINIYAVSDRAKAFQ